METFGKAVELLRGALSKQGIVKNLQSEENWVRFREVERTNQEYRARGRIVLEWRTNEIGRLTQAKFDVGNDCPLNTILGRACINTEPFFESMLSFPDQA